tara:strand:+ start:235 stop:435 length:201 start_codon:yes stop_codon:yes gene_type:complete
MSEEHIKKIVSRARKAQRLSYDLIESEKINIKSNERIIRQIQSICKHDFIYDGVHQCRICGFIGGV